MKNICGCLHFIGIIYMCVYNFQSDWDKCRKQNMSAKQGIHKWSWRWRINVVAKCIVHRHITVELTAHWLAKYICICSTPIHIQSGRYIWSEAYVINVKCLYISVVVTLLTVLSWYDLLWYSCLICAHKLCCYMWHICGIWGAYLLLAYTYIIIIWKIKVSLVGFFLFLTCMHSNVRPICRLLYLGTWPKKSCFISV